MRKFYVYVFLDPRKSGYFIYDDLSFEYEPFYVGKGTGDRINISKYDNSNSYKTNKITKIAKTNLDIISYNLYDNLTEEESFLLEIEVIKKIGKIINENGPLVNFSDGGSGGDNITNHPNIEDIKKRMSDSHKGDKNYFYGKKHTKETINFLSEFNKNKNTGSSNPFYGKNHTVETKRIISEANRKFIGENNPFYGKNHTEESKEKIREKRIGNKNSEESKSKTSETLKKKNWVGKNNPNAIKYIIMDPEGKILEFIGLIELNEKLKGLNPRRIISQKEHKGYKLLDRIIINKI